MTGRSCGELDSDKQETIVITYPDGSDACIGDKVDYDGVPAVVEDIIDTESKLTEWGVHERGLMFKTDAYGLSFEPEEDSTCWDAIVLLARASA